jgi:hypothetical protein
MNLPKLTPKQHEILKLLYTYRFLNRIQIQAFLKHKDYKTINLWLKDLREKEYVVWIYSTDFAKKTKPAVYYLGLNGIRYLKTIGPATYSLDELRKRYRESSRSQTYLDRCQLLADCCLNMEQKRTPSRAYFYEIETEYLHADGYYHFLLESELIHPHLCIAKRMYDPSLHEDVTQASYLLEVFDETLPRYRMKKRLTDYVRYLDDEVWDPDGDDHTLPIVLLVCPRTTDLIYAKRRTRGLLADIWEYDDEERPHVRFTTLQKLKELGMTGEIWEEV